ncbi:hypothetical protein PHYSODRAFT_341250 [Phytophthora sojae]|uniref:Uncharacterized protein n=1 Tax=Phytophthora sojae (strain P6497) TaxID=1094619 RepID=G5ACM2_PHYSP|nr:hypothetical protein PHYSODRAFT_341250 [Phytophthora sojae]EGZ07096.1 hypothetical protein PHYSODRAFT_341250 [Phytophthora sojae]|eukprot:XP_009537860.1 hypothetical protein PHYSODRAFT_341250 [Phytophthora sojae]
MLNGFLSNSTDDSFVTSSELLLKRRYRGRYEAILKAEKAKTASDQSKVHPSRHSNPSDDTTLLEADAVSNLGIKLKEQDVLPLITRGLEFYPLAGAPESIQDFAKFVYDSQSAA